MMFRPTTVVLLITAFCFVPPVVPSSLSRRFITKNPYTCEIYVQHCYCWIGSENWKAYDFGSVGKFAYERRCQRICQKLRVGYIGWVEERRRYTKRRLCSLIDKTVRHDNLQIFSKLEHVSVSRRQIPFPLCCRKPTKCPMGHGMYIYDEKHNTCVRERSQGCIPRDPAGDKKPPVCCLKSSLTGRFTTFDCQPPQNLRAKSVDCYATPGPPSTRAARTTKAQWHSTSVKPGTKGLKKDEVKGFRNH